MSNSVDAAEQKKIIKMVLKKFPKGNGEKIEFMLDFGVVEVIVVQKTN